MGLSMERTVTLLAAVWTFTVLPSLCTSGLLVHPCDCDSPSGCRHETECSDDPCCAAVIVQPDLSVRALALPELTAAPLDDAATVGADELCAAPLQRPSQSLDRWRHAFSDNDLPLLI